MKFLRWATPRFVFSCRHTRANGTGESRRVGAHRSECRDTARNSRPEQLFRDNERAGFDPEMRPGIAVRKDESAASGDPCARPAAFCGRRRRTKEERGMYPPALEARGCAQNLRMQSGVRHF